MFIYHFLQNNKPLCGDKEARTGFHVDWSKVTCPRCLAVHGERDLSSPVPQAPPPEPSEKKEPSYTDDDTIKFGKYRGERLKDIPASYLHWLWTQRPISDKRLENYIFNNITALKREHPDGIWT